MISLGWGVVRVLDASTARGKTLAGYARTLYVTREEAEVRAAASGREWQAFEVFVDTEAGK